MVTQGIAARSDVWDIVQQIRRYNSFGSDTDTHGEHDFGSIEVNGQRIFWKIDYYGEDLASSAPDPANADITTRVMTIGLLAEY